LMARVFKSGAFIQQCFSVHPLCLSLHSFARSDLLVFTCTSCGMTHRVMVRALRSRLPVALASEAERGAEEQAHACLARCATVHPLALAIREMDVVRDWVGLRCADCRRLYDVDAAGFETHQR
jgi:hypothetical protein